jgi:hypothetical protein
VKTGIARLRLESTGHGEVKETRSSLGGPARYEVTVTVKNLTNELLRRVAVSASGAGPTVRATESTQRGERRR